MARKITVEILADASQLNRKFTEAAASTRVFTKEVERSGRGVIAGSLAITGMGRAIAFASLQFLGGYGLAFALSHSTKAAMDFQQQMVLIKTQAGGLNENIRNLSKAVLTLAPTVATSPETLAKGLYHIESAGIRGEKAIAALKVAAMGAKIGVGDLESTTNALVAALKSGIKGTGDLTHAMGVLDAITGAGNLRLEDLTKALHTGVTATARQVGISLTGLGAALSTLTIQGVPAGQAATRLRTALALLAAPTAKAAKELKAIGVGPLEIARALKQGDLPAGLDLLKLKLQESGKSALEATATIVRAFGAARSSATIIQLLQHTDQVRASFAQIEQQGSTATFAQKWNIQVKTAAYATDQLKTSIEVLEVFIGQAFLPVVQKGARSLSHWLSNSEHQKEIQQDLKQVIKGVTDALEVLWRIIHDVTSALGGMKNTVEILVGIKVIKMIAGWATAMKAYEGSLLAVAGAQGAVTASAGTMAAAETGAMAATRGGGAAAAAAMGVEAAAANLYPAAVGRTIRKQGGYKPVPYGSRSVYLAEGGMTPEFSKLPPGAAARGAGGQFIARGETTSMVGSHARSMEGGRLAGRSYPPQQSVTKIGYRSAVSTSEGSTGFMFAAQKGEKDLTKLGSASKLASSAVGKTALAMGGLAIAVQGSIVSYEIFNQIFRKIGFSGLLSRGGSWFEGVVHPGSPPPVPTHKTAQTAIEDIHDQIQKSLEKNGSLKVYADVQARDPANGPPSRVALARRISGEMQDSLAKKKLMAEVRAHFKNISDHDAKIWVDYQIKKIQGQIDLYKSAVQIPLAPTAGQMPFVTDTGAGTGGAFHLGPPPPTLPSELSTLQAQEAEARRKIAAGDESYQAALVALLKKQVALDDKAIAFQQNLLKKAEKNPAKYGSPTKHEQLIAQLQADAASALDEITSTQKKQFQLPMKLQLAQAKAATTASTADDAAVSKAIIAYARTVIASAKSSMQDKKEAYDAIAAATQATKGFQIPLALQLEQSRAATTDSNKDDIAVYKKIIALAKTVINSSKSTMQDKKDAYDALASAQQSLKQSFQIPLGLQLEQADAAITQSTADDRAAALKIKKIALKVRHSSKSSLADKIAADQQIAAANQVLESSFKIPYKLQLAQAKAATTSMTSDDVAVARKIKAYAEQLIKSGKLRGQALIDAFNAIASENSVIGQSVVKTAYRAPSTHELTAGLGLTREQRVAEEQRLAQYGAHGQRTPIPGMKGVLGIPVNVNPEGSARGIGNAPTPTKTVTPLPAPVRPDDRGTARGIGNAVAGHITKAMGRETQSADVKVRGDVKIKATKVILDGSVDGVKGGGGTTNVTHHHGRTEVHHRTHIAPSPADRSRGNGKAVYYQTINNNTRIASHFAVSGASRQQAAVSHHNLPRSSFLRALLSSNFLRAATGAVVPGSGHGDTVPALLTPGEIIFNREQQRNLGKMLGVPGAGPHRLFSKVSRFATGGVVPSMSIANNTSYVQRGSEGGGGNVTINIYGGDLSKVERVVTKALQKQRRHSAPQRRGNMGGHTLGID